MYWLVIKKRGRIAYDDKRVLLGDLANGQPNPNTYANTQLSLIKTVQVKKDAESTPARNDLQIVIRGQRHIARFARAHALTIKRACRGNPNENSDVDEAETQKDDFVIAEQAAAARLGTLIRINNVINQICAT